MDDQRKNPTERGSRDLDANRAENRSSRPNDLPDSPEDQEKLEPDETFIELPDVKDIPGQEFINAPPIGILGDTTISSDDEEGKNLFDPEDEEDLRITGNESDVSREERNSLARTESMSTSDENNLQRASMDNRDFQGDELNEKSFGSDHSGADLDVPGAELDDRNEDIGEEDEENNNYSPGNSDNDNLKEGTP